MFRWLKILAIRVWYLFGIMNVSGNGMERALAASKKFEAAKPMERVNNGYDTNSTGLQEFGVDSSREDFGYLPCATFGFLALVTSGALTFLGSERTRFEQPDQWTERDFKSSIIREHMEEGNTGELDRHAVALLNIINKYQNEPRNNQATGGSRNESNNKSQEIQQVANKQISISKIKDGHMLVSECSRNQSLDQDTNLSRILKQIEMEIHSLKTRVTAPAVGNTKTINDECMEIYEYLVNRMAKCMDELGFLLKEDNTTEKDGMPGLKLYAWMVLRVFEGFIQESIGKRFPLHMEPNKLMDLINRIIMTQFKQWQKNQPCKQTNKEAEMPRESINHREQLILKYGLPFQLENEKSMSYVETLWEKPIERTIKIYSGSKNHVLMREVHEILQHVKVSIMGIPTSGMVSRDEFWGEFMAIFNSIQVDGNGGISMEFLKLDPAWKFDMLKPELTAMQQAIIQKETKAEIGILAFNLPALRNLVIIAHILKQFPDEKDRELLAASDNLQPDIEQIAATVQVMVYKDRNGVSEKAIHSCDDLMKAYTDIKEKNDLEKLIDDHLAQTRHHFPYTESITTYEFVEEIWNHIQNIISPSKCEIENVRWCDENGYPRLIPLKYIAAKIVEKLQKTVHYSKMITNSDFRFSIVLKLCFERRNRFPA